MLDNVTKHAGQWRTNLHDPHSCLDQHSSRLEPEQLQDQQNCQKSPEPHNHWDLLPQPDAAVSQNHLLCHHGFDQMDGYHPIHAYYYQEHEDFLREILENKIRWCYRNNFICKLVYDCVLIITKRFCIQNNVNVSRALKMLHEVYTGHPF